MIDYFEAASNLGTAEPSDPLLPVPLSPAKRGRRHRNFKVTAFLVDELCAEPPMLDALLEFQMAGLMRSVLESRNGHRHAGFRPGFPAARGEPVEHATIPTPIARTAVTVLDRNGQPRRWLVPRCSSPLIPEAAGDRHSHFTRRFPFERARLMDSDRNGVIGTAGGRFKSSRLPLRRRLVDRIVWFCVGEDRVSTSGNPSRSRREFRRLLHTVQFLGGKLNFAGSFIDRWLIEEVDYDWSWFAPAGPDDARQILMWPLPVDDIGEVRPHLPANLAGYRLGFASCVGPYWHPDHHCAAVIPMQ